jgi:spermidine synthase
MLLAGCFYLYFPNSFLNSLGNMKNSSLIFYGEDSTGIVWVTKHPQFKALKTNLALTSSTYNSAKRYMRLLGALPVLACKNPENALVVCFGTGTTAGATTAIKTVKHVDIVELSSMVIKASPCFADSDLKVLHDPKVTVHINDGRNFLLNTKNTYDVITFEPPPLFSAGVVNLYSTEFYRVVKQHLKPGGVVAQWVPSFDVSNPLWKMVLRSFLDTFPNCSLWMSNSGEGIILGSEKPLAMDVNTMREQLNSSPELRAALDETGLSDPYDVLSTFMMSDQKLRSYVGSAVPITDDHPYMEFYSPFLGRPLSDWEISQAAGNMKDGLMSTFKITGASDKQLEDRFKAMQHFRRNESRFYPECSLSPTELQESMESAKRLNPGNQFFPWYEKNGSAVPNTTPDNYQSK